MSNRLSYLEESTVEKHQFEQMESKVCIVFKKIMYFPEQFQAFVLISLCLCYREENLPRSWIWKDHLRKDKRYTYFGVYHSSNRG